MVAVFSMPCLLCTKAWSLDLWRILSTWNTRAQTKPDDQRVAFMISSAIVIHILRFLIGLLLINIIYSFSGIPFLPYTIIWN